MERQVGVFLAVCAVFGASVCVLGVRDSAAQEPAEAVVPAAGVKKTRTVFPQKTELNFDGINIQGEIKAPGEFYFQNRNEEKFESWVKRRKNFHPEMLRDALMTK
ncbi:hypothetical protein WDW86_08225 [Bdellovibrionota bacterium FG-2]